MTFMLAVFACGPSSGGAGSSTATRVLDEASTVPPFYEGGDYRWGETVASGFDLDHDGALEWAASAPRNGYDVHAGIHAFEGRDLVASRFAGDAVHDDDRSREIGSQMVGGGDTDGDGFGELLFADARVWIPSRFRLVRSTDESDDVHILLPDGYEPEWALFVRAAEGDQVAVASQRGASGWRIDLLGGEDLVAGGEVAVGPATVAYERGESGERLILDDSAAVDVDSDGLDELVYTTADDGNLTLVACDARRGSTRDEDCLLELYSPSAEAVGGRIGAGDLDGDGQVEVLAADLPDGQQPGTLTVFEHDGSSQAVISGTRNAQFGHRPQVVQTDDGPWLWVLDRISSQKGTLFAFEGASVEGELVDVDAQRRFELPTTGGSMSEVVPYRQTPAAPLQLGVGGPNRDDGYVYLVDW